MQIEPVNKCQLTLPLYAQNAGSCVLSPSNARWVTALDISVVHSEEALHCTNDLGIPIQKCRFKITGVVAHPRFVYKI